MRLRGTIILLASTALGSAPAAVCAQALDSAASVTAATLPLPAELRAAATVVRLSHAGRPDTLRAGSNPMVCFADAPTDTLLDVRCYHQSFVPLIYESRRLHQSGLPDSAVEARMSEEIRSGTLPAPSGGTAGYRVLGPIRGYDPVTGQLGPSLDRWQSIHIPFATTETLGIGTSEHGTEPFMMASGTWWAHVMVMEQPLRY